MNGKSKYTAIIFSLTMLTGTSCWGAAPGECPDVDARNADGSTPLMHAAFNGNTKMVNRLIQAGANVNARDNNNETPLMWLAQSNDAREGRQSVYDILETLLGNRADRNLVDNDGHTAEWYAWDRAASYARPLRLAP